MSRSISKFIRKNIFILMIMCGVAFVFLIFFYKIFVSKPTYIFAKVKISQGLWWANTARPQLWLVESLRPGLKDQDIIGAPSAEIISAAHYPWLPSQQNSQFEIYLTLKLKVSRLTGGQGYSYSRSTLGIASPIDLKFPGISVSGTVIGLSETPFSDKLSEKTVFLTKSYALPWEYDDIRVGSKYFDGRQTVFEITDKSAVDESTLMTAFNQVYNNNALSGFNETRKLITVKAKIKVKKIGSDYVFGEETILNPGKDFNFSLPGLTFNNYIITKIE